jgi:hypothetical protein
MTEINALPWDELQNIFIGLRIGNKPKDISNVDHKLVKEIRDLFLRYVDHKDDIDIKLNRLQVHGKIEYLTRSGISLEDLVSAYTTTKSNLPQGRIKRSFATYVVLGRISSSVVDNTIQDLEDFFGTLKGYHALVVKNLVIRLVDSKSLKTIAKYKQNEDVIEINVKRTGNTKEEYGSLRYVVLHELGHRYLTKHPQNWNVDDRKWITTKYSGIDSLTGEEKFAELFAMMHWENKYSQYKEQIRSFKSTIHK